MSGNKRVSVKKVIKSKGRQSKDAGSDIDLGGSTGGIGLGGLGIMRGGQAGGHHEEETSGMTAVPEDQIRGLTVAELNKDFTRVLTNRCPETPENIVVYSFKEKAYIKVLNISQLSVQLTLNGNMVHRDSDEGRKMMSSNMGGGDFSASGSSSGGSVGEEEEQQGEGTPAEGEGAPVEGEGEKEKAEEPEEEAVAEGTEAGEAEEEHDEDEDGGKDDEEDGNGGEGGKKKQDKKVTNQFNFSERSAQTRIFPPRTKETMTDPPPRQTISDQINQWIIFDAYQEDWARLQLEKLREERALKEPHKKGASREGDALATLSTLQAPPPDIRVEKNWFLTIPRNCKIIERMVSQNSYDDIAQDFKYYDDAGDEFIDQVGSLLPLWKFEYAPAKRFHVTCLTWNPKYWDMFAVGFGSYDFLDQSSGMILVYTLKNYTHPEYIYQTVSGVMAVDFHKIRTYILAAGFYDGNVRWQSDDLEEYANFMSISTDGRVVRWTIVKGELIYQDMTQIRLENVSCVGPNGSTLVTLGGATTFDFHPLYEDTYLVGTDEGMIHLCSTSQGSAYLDTYTAHSMVVYKVAWNTYHEHVFITCSADWTIKIWDGTTSVREPVFTFDLDNAVGDVAWAPFASTTFAAVTTVGKVHVFDLNINKYEPICSQLVISKKKLELTHIAFNRNFPVIIVGDTKGTVLCLKLSPNLRKKPKAKKAAIGVAEVRKPEEVEAERKLFEFAKIERLLALARQPDASKKRKKKRTEQAEHT